MFASKIVVHVVSWKLTECLMLEALLTIDAHNALMYGSAGRVSLNHVLPITCTCTITTSCQSSSVLVRKF